MIASVITIYIVLNPPDDNSNGNPDENPAEPNPVSYPGCRSRVASWITSDGILWLFGGHGFNGTAYFGYLNDLWKFNTTTAMWAWVSGNNTRDIRGVYGTLRSPDVLNYPGSRADSITWTGIDGSLWLFGGYGYDEVGAEGQLNDLWKFNCTTKIWTWMSGNKTRNAVGVYGTRLTPNPADYPGCRYGSVSWISANGTLWLHGGYGFNDTVGLKRLNDLWKFDITSNIWTWMSGNTTDINGVYGVKGEPDPTNFPGRRQDAVSWTGADETLWLLGGYGYDKWGNFGSLNDLWQYNLSSNNWRWVSGNETRDMDGMYGTRGTPDLANYPGSRWKAIAWQGTDGSLWLSGGQGHDAAGSWGDLNDVWKFNNNTDTWTWVSGNNSINQNGIYGLKGIGGAANYPGGREDATAWKDQDGFFWLFGGGGYPASGGAGRLNDLWRFNNSTNVWAWMAGNDTISVPGVYGIKE